MKKIASMAAALMLTVSLSACTGTTDTPAEPTATVTVTPTPTETPTLSDETKEDIFLDLVRDEYPMTESLPDENIIGLAEAACNAFDSGASVQEVLSAVADTGGENSETFGFIIGAGVEVYCPEHGDLIDNFLGGNA